MMTKRSPVVILFVWMISFLTPLCAVGEDEENASSGMPPEEVKLTKGRLILTGDPFQTESYQSELLFSDLLECDVSPAIREELERKQVSPYNGPVAARMFRKASLYAMIHPGTSRTISFYDTRHGLLVLRERVSDIVKSSGKAYRKSKAEKTMIRLHLRISGVSGAEKYAQLLKESLVMHPFVLVSSFYDRPEKNNMPFYTLMIRTKNGTKKNEPDLSVVLTDPFNMEIFSQNYTAGTSVGKIFYDLCRALKLTGALEQADPAQVEQRLLDEWSALCQANSEKMNFTDHKVLRRLNRVLCSFNRNDISRRKDEIYLELCGSVMESYPAASRKAFLKRALARMQDFRRDFPSCVFPKDQLGNTHYFGSHPLLALRPLQTMDPVDPVLFRQCKAENDRWLSPGGRIEVPEIRSFARLNQERHAIRQRFAAQEKHDPANLIRYSWNADMAELLAAQSYLKHHPSGRLPAFSNYFPPRRQNSNTPRNWEQITEILRNEWQVLEELYRRIPGKNSQSRLLELGALRDYLISDRSNLSLRRILRRKIDLMKKAGIFQLRPRGAYGGAMPDAVRGLFDFRDPRQKELLLTLNLYPYQYLFEQEETPLQGKVLCLLESGVKDPQWLGEQASAVRALWQKALTDKKLSAAFSILIRDLYLKTADKALETCLPQLNGDFRIRSVDLGVELCLASCRDGDKMYFLLQGEDGLLALKELTLSTGTVRDCNMPPVFHDDFQTKRNYAGTPEPCSLMYAGNGIILAGGRNVIYLWNRNNGEWSILRDFPGDSPVCAVLKENRLYILCGGTEKGSKEFISMHSCDLSGYDRKTYFNGKRSPAQHELDRLYTGRVSGFFTAPDGNLLFTVHSLNHFATLYSFDFQTETFRKKIDFPLESKHFTMREVLPGYFLGTAGKADQCAYFTLSADDQARVQWLFSPLKNNTEIFRSVLPETNLISNPATLAKGDYLAAVGGLYPVILFLNNPEKSLPLFLPPAENVYYIPQENMYVFPAIRGGRVFLVNEAK